MAAKRKRKRKAVPAPEPVNLADAAIALREVAKTLAICDAIRRGDRTVGFVGPPANREGIVAAQDREED